MLKTNLQTWNRSPFMAQPLWQARHVSWHMTRYKISQQLLKDLEKYVSWNFDNCSRVIEIPAVMLPVPVSLRPSLRPFILCQFFMYFSACCDPNVVSLRTWHWKVLTWTYDLTFSLIEPLQLIPKTIPHILPGILLAWKTLPALVACDAGNILFWRSFQEEIWFLCCMMGMWNSLRCNSPLSNVRRSENLNTTIPAWKKQTRFCSVAILILGSFT